MLELRQVSCGEVMPLTIRRRDGAVLHVSSWRAWRELAWLHQRQPCPACGGEGYQEWMIEASAGTPTRWFSEQCRSCRGKGWRIP